MNISQHGVDFIKSFEGLRLTAYKAVSSEKYWTIGYGHYGSDVRQGQTITKAEAEQMLKDDLVEYVTAVDRVVTRDVNQNQFDALVSFTYNVGISAFTNSTLLKRVNAYQDDDVRYQFSRWNKSGGVVYAGLTRRRGEEADLYFTPYVEAPTTDPTEPPTKDPDPVDPTTPVDPNESTETPADPVTDPPSQNGSNNGNTGGTGGAETGTGGGSSNGTDNGSTSGNGGSTSNEPNVDDSYLSSTNVTTSTTYTVRKGDTLTSIARKFNLKLTKLLFANKKTVVNANIIKVGQTLVVPKANYKYYTVVAGDTLFRIAYDNKTTVSKLLTLNPSIKDKNKIIVGQQIRLK